jgi:hypothetical protein
MVSEPVEQRGSELLVAPEDFDPFGEGEVGSDDHAASLVALGQQVEEQLAAGAVEGHEAQLVELCGAAHDSTHVEHLLM